jgi:DNA (cytosine-5)-methyltransferase 1
MIRLATLFSGVGTPEQSLKHLKVEHETVFACEIDKYARNTYLANNQEPKTFYDDVYNIDGNKYKNQIDILIGGSPCQSFSIAGKRMGTSCPRGNLIYEYFRIVEEVKPKVFIYENVKGFLSIDKIDKKEKYGETFKNFVQSFKELGYTIYYEILNTKDYGVPQNRERIYIVGFRDEVEFEFTPKEELKLRLKDMLEDEVDEKYLLSEKLVSYFNEHKKKHEEKGNGFGWKPTEGDSIASTITARVFKMGATDNYIKLKQTHIYNVKTHDCRISPSITAQSGGYSEPKIAHPVREVGRRLDENGKRCDDNKDIPITRRYEIGEKEISNCLSGVQKDSYVATKENIDSKHIFRKLTERECFRLQGFDDSFIFPPKISSTQLYKQAGNGMSRNILDMIFTQIFKSKNFDLSSNS